MAVQYYTRDMGAITLGADNQRQREIAESMAQLRSQSSNMRPKRQPDYNVVRAAKRAKEAKRDGYSMSNAEIIVKYDMYDATVKMRWPGGYMKQIGGLGHNEANRLAKTLRVVVVNEALRV